MNWRIDSRTFIRLFVLLNILLAVYNLLNFGVAPRNTRPCVISINESVFRPPPLVHLGSTLTPTTQGDPATNITGQPQVQKRGQYTVVLNTLCAERRYNSNESITLTTQGTIDFLHHTETLCRRWDGPVEVAVYAPGPEFSLALRLIGQMRLCGHPCVRQNISWHLVYDTEESPANVPKNDTVFNCSEGTLKVSSNYRQVTKKTYPINVLRNVARQSATTRHIMASDIELYPSANIIPRFLRMLENEARNRKTSPNVYVLPIFEVDKNLKAPETKEELISLLKSNKAIYFHKWVCDSCQNFPGREHWGKTLPTDNETLSIFVTTKRDRRHSSWEPIYIGTNDEPLYDERLSWDGKRDKMSQMFEMCLMQYTLLILDNAFLVHAPGIKQISKVDLRRRAPYVRKNNLVFNDIMKGLKIKYKEHHDC